jgi:hypothetical protein
MRGIGNQALGGNHKAALFQHAACRSEAASCTRLDVLAMFRLFIYRLPGTFGRSIEADVNEFRENHAAPDQFSPSGLLITLSHRDGARPSVTRWLFNQHVSTERPRNVTVSILYVCQALLRRKRCQSTSLTCGYNPLPPSSYIGCLNVVLHTYIHNNHANPKNQILSRLVHKS